MRFFTKHIPGTMVEIRFKTLHDHDEHLFMLSMMAKHNGQKQPRL